MKKKTCVWLSAAVAAVVVIGAVLGGVLGTQLHHHHKSNDSSGSGSGSNVFRVNVLATSRLAAANYTDETGIRHRVVLYQDPWNNLIVRQWNASDNSTASSSSSSSSWSMRNITAEVADPNEHSDRLGLGLGSNPFVASSPLAVSTIDDAWVVHLWFVNGDGRLQSLFWSRNRASLETDDGLVGDSNAHIGVDDSTGSSLAAVWQPWLSAPVTGVNYGSWIVAYQSRSGAVEIANSSDWATRVVVDASHASDLSGLALVPSVASDSDANSGVRELALVWQAKDGVRLRSSAGNFSDGHDTLLFDNTATSSSTPEQVAFTTFDNWHRVLFVDVAPEGALALNLWDGSQYNASVGAATISGSPPAAAGTAANFGASAIAATADGRLYAIVDDQILEFANSPSDPATFSYVGAVVG